MACMKLRSRSAVEECIKLFQETSLSKFVHYNSSKTFSCLTWRPPSKGHVYWEWNKADVRTAPIPFDMVPFMFIGHRHMACHQGVDLAKKRKEDNAAIKRNIITQGHTLIQSKTRTQGSKKVGCPALIRITRIAKFPQYKLNCKVSLGQKREVAKSLKKNLLEDPTRVYWDEIYYVCIPGNTDHVGHPVATLQTSHSTKMDERVEKRIVELTKRGIKNVGEMRGHIKHYVETYLSESLLETPPVKRRCFSPSYIDIRSVMHRVREEMYKYAFEQENSSSSEDCSDFPYPPPMPGSEVDVGHSQLATKQHSLKTRCVGQLHSMIDLVESMKDDADLEKLASVLGGIHSNIQSTTKPLQTTSVLPNMPINELLPCVRTNFKPIKVIIEGSNPIQQNSPDSPVITNDSILLNSPESPVEISGSIPLNPPNLSVDMRDSILLNLADSLIQDSPSIVEIAVHEDHLDEG